MSRILKNDRESAKCRDELAKWRVVRSHLAKQFRNFGLSDEGLVAAADKQIQSLTNKLKRYDTLHRIDYPDRENLFSRLGLLEQTPTALIEARIAVGWSQQELAVRANLPRQQICRYEGELYANIKLSNAITLARILAEAASDSGAWLESYPDDAGTSLESYPDDLGTWLESYPDDFVQMK